MYENEENESILVKRKLTGPYLYPDHILSDTPTHLLIGMRTICFDTEVFLQE